jgi:hypothetical protein
MKKLLLILSAALIHLSANAQITTDQISGTWALSAINGNDDSTLVIVYRPDFESKKFFKNHALNNVWEIRDTSKRKYKSEYSKIQLSDELLLSYLEGMKNMFYQFGKFQQFKENTATDSLFVAEQLQDAGIYEINGNRTPSYKLSGDTLIIIDAMQGNSLLVGRYLMKIQEGYLVLSDSAGTTWYFKRINELHLFPFKPNFPH